MPASRRSGPSSSLAAAAGWLFAIFPVAVVLAVDPAGYSPFGPAKYLVITTFVLTGLALLVAGRRTLLADRRIVWCWLGLLVWWAIAATVGVDRFHGWIGLPERRLGVIAWVLFFVAYVVGGSLDVAQRRRVVLGGVVAGGASGLWAVLQGFGWSPIDVGGATNRLGGSFGSAAYLAAAGALFVPLCIGVVLDDTVDEWWRRAAAVAAFWGVIAVAGSGTRAAWVGLAVASIAVLVARRSALRTSSRIVGIIAGLGVLAFAVGGWLLPHSERPGDAINRDAGSARLDEWKVAVGVLGSRPVLGAGPEGYRIVAGRHISANYERAHGRRVLPDRAHNGLLDIGVAGGTPAMLLYGALLMMVGRRGWWVLRDGPGWMAGGAVGLVAYVAQQQFLFPLAEIDPIAWLIAGVVTTGVTARASAPVWSVRRSSVPHESASVGSVSGRSIVGRRASEPSASERSASEPSASERSASERPVPEPSASVRSALGRSKSGRWASVRSALGRSKSGRWASVRSLSGRSKRSVRIDGWRAPRAFAAAPFLLAVVGMWFGVREIVADGHTQSTVEALAANGPDRALLEAVQAVQLRPDILRNRIALARTLSIVGGADSFKAAVKVLNEALDWSPRDPVLRRERGLLLTTIAQSSHGGADIDAALASWEQQAHDDPNNADTLVELGFAQVTANRMGDAEKTWTRAAELQPRSAAALLDLVKLYLSDKRLTQARAAVDEAGRRAAGDPAVTQAESAVQAAGG